MNSDVTLRAATFSDIEQLEGLYAAFFAEDGIAVPAARIRTNLGQMLTDDRARIVVAESAGAVVGLASVSTTFGVEFGCAAEFEDLYVVPNWRGRGVAHKLVDAIIAWSDGQGAEVIALVITGQAEAEQGLTRFYQRHGFVVTDRITMYRERGRVAIRVP